MQCCRPTTEDSYFTAKHAVHGPSHLSVDSKRVYINCEEEQGFLFGSLAYMEYIFIMYESYLELCFNVIKN